MENFTKEVGTLFVTVSGLSNKTDSLQKNAQGIFENIKKLNQAVNFEPQSQLVSQIDFSVGSIKEVFDAMKFGYMNEHIQNEMNNPILQDLCTRISSLDQSVQQSITVSHSTGLLLTQLLEHAKKNKKNNSDADVEEVD